jgi:hypothetical protein
MQSGQEPFRGTEWTLREKRRKMFQQGPDTYLTGTVLTIRCLSISYLKLKDITVTHWPARSFIRTVIHSATGSHGGGHASH